MAGEYVQRLCGGLEQTNNAVSNHSALVPIRMALSAGSGAAPSASVGARLLALGSSASWWCAIAGVVILAFPLGTLVLVMQSRRKTMDRRRRHGGCRKTRSSGESDGEREGMDAEASDDRGEDDPDAPLMGAERGVAMGQPRQSTSVPRLPCYVLPSLGPHWDSREVEQLTAAALVPQPQLPKPRMQRLSPCVVVTKPQGPRPGACTLESPVPMLLSPMLPPLDTGSMVPLAESADV